MPRTIPNQKHFAASQEEIDAGKFLRTINSGAQAQVALFESHIQKMGQEVGASWRLVSLGPTNLIFEDVDTHLYYGADIQKIKAGRVSIKNIREFRITDEKKATQFSKQVLKLVEAIGEDDNAAAEEAFESITERRFRGRVIPESGYVTTRDGISRYVRVANSILPEELKRPIIEAVSKALSDNIKTSRGRVVEAVFNNRTFEIPVTEMTRRLVVARNMKKVAEHAFMSEGFQNRVGYCASLLSRGDQESIKQAVSCAADLLKEEQEFSLLTLKEMRELMENTLAARGILNEKLGTDLGLMFYRTNCRINHSVILDEWKSTARLTEYAPLVENVRRLDESDKFERDYGIFLETFFREDMTTKVAKAKMYLSALKDMRNVLEGGQDEELLEGLDEYITRLEEAGEEVDDATLMEVEELVASTSENLLGDVSNLSDFDKIPQPAGAEPSPTFGDEDLGAEQGQGDLNINAGGGGPALPFGGGGEAGAPAAAAPAGGAEKTPEGEEEGEEGAPDEEEEMQSLLAASAERKGKVVSESKGKCKKCKKVGTLKEGGMCAECGAQMESFAADLAKLNVSQLREELAVWQKDAAKFFSEDGVESCTTQLSLCIEHAEKLGDAQLVAGFRELIAVNTPVDDSEDTVAEESLYDFDAPEDIEIDRDYGVTEDHDTWKGKMKQSKVGGQEGSKEPAKGDAMGSQDDEDSNTMDGVPPNTLKKDSTRKVGLAREGTVVCKDCSGEYELAECVTREGVVCPECGASMYEQVDAALSENLSDEGHEMDRIDGDKGGVAATSLASSDGASAGGSKEGMDGQDGKGVADKGLKNSDGRSAVGGKGKADGMDQDGKPISDKGKGKGSVKNLTEEGFCKDCHKPADKCECESEEGDEDEVEEDQYKSATRRRRHAAAGRGRSSINATESAGKGTRKIDEQQTVVLVTDQPVDDVISQIASSMAANNMEDDLAGAEDEFMGPDEMMPPDDDMMGPEDDEMMPPEGEEGGEPPLGGEEEGGEPPPFGGEEEGGEPDEGGEDEGGEPPPFEDEDEDEEEEGPPEMEEGKLPPALAKHKFGKKDKGEKDSGSATEGKCDCPGCDDPNCACQNKKPVKEDNDITTPQGKDYDSEGAARKDGDGKQMRPKPSMKQTDEAGRKNAGPARSAGK